MGTACLCDKKEVNCKALRGRSSAAWSSLSLLFIAGVALVDWFLLSILVVQRPSGSLRRGK